MEDLVSVRRLHALQLRAYQQQLRVKDLKEAEKRVLQLKLSQIRQNRDKLEMKIQRDIRVIKDEMNRNSHINDDVIGTWDDITSKTLDMRNKDSRSNSETWQHNKAHDNFVTPLTSLTSSTRDVQPRISHKPITTYNLPAGYSQCRYDDAVTQCTTFPCVRPRNYHRIGFDIHTDKHLTDRFITSTQKASTKRDTLLNDLESTSVRRSKRSGLDQVHLKERALKTIIADMKIRSEANRPKDWCTNYGNPTSRRKILKVARPSGVADIPGLFS